MKRESGGLFRVAWLFYLLLASVAILWIGMRSPGLHFGLLIDPRHWWLDAALGLAGGVLLLGAWAGASRWLPGARELERKLAALLSELTPADAFGLAVLSGLAEELFFRGAVQGSWGLIPATLLFGALHTGPGKAFRLWTLFAVLAGFMLGGLMFWRGNLLAPILAHFLVNAVNLRRLLRSSGDQLETEGCTVNDTVNSGPKSGEERIANTTTDSREGGS